MSRPTGLYGWIQSNDGRSTGLFALFLLAVQIIAAVTLFMPLALVDADHAPFLGSLGYVFRYAPVVLIASMVWFAWEMFWHIETVKRAVGFRFVDANDEPRLCHILEPLIVMTGLPVPFVGVIESSARNAFACGIARKKAVIVVTRGLIDNLSNDELAAVLAHELGHIKHGDIRLMAAANIFIGGLKKLHQNNPFRFTPIHVVLAVAIPALLIVTFIGGFLGHAAMRMGQVARLVLASSREFIADAEAAQLTKNPAALAAALIKVEGNYRVETARHEDDAMMIAGDTDGPDATHPTVAQRIAALARVTGSMVWNAPGAPALAVSTTLSQAQSAALLQQLPEARVLPRVRSGSRENWLGMTRLNSVMALAAVGALLAIHQSELSNPRAIAAKFDVRPISIMLGAPFACHFEAMFGQRAATCERHMGSDAYRDFEGQKNTLAGWLADLSKKRRESGYLRADVTLGNFEGFDVARRPYLGQSGKLKGVTAIMDADGNFPRRETEFGASDQTPLALEAAEIRGVGCFPASMNYGKPEGEYTLDQEIGIGDNWAKHLEWVARSAQPPEAADGWTKAEWFISGEAPPTGSIEDLWLRDYAERREAYIRTAYDLWGLPGLKAIQTAYASDPHRTVLGRMLKRLRDPVFLKMLSPRERARMEVLTTAPEKFVPCAMIRRLAVKS